MVDVEKVIKGLETCIKPGFKYCTSECPYFNKDDYRYDCDRMKNDAIELLKEQEPVKPVDIHIYRKMFVNVRSGYCPICNNPVDEEEGNNFCCTCGRRLNWND